MRPRFDDPLLEVDFRLGEKNEGSAIDPMSACRLPGRLWGRLRPFRSIGTWESMQFNRFLLVKIFWLRPDLTRGPYLATV